MKYYKFILVIGIFTALILNSTGAVENPEISFESPDIEINDSISQPYNVSELSNMSESEEDKFINYTNSHSINQQHSSINWLVDDSKTKSDKDNSTDEGTQNPDDPVNENYSEESSSTSLSSSSSSESSTSNKQPWSNITANLSANSVDHNETAYIEGTVKGDEKRNISVFLGEEQILEKDPLNGEFKIPIDANEVNNRELKLVSNDREIRFSLDVNSPSGLESKDSNDCITPSQQGILGVNMPHNNGLIGVDSSRPCFNSSITDDLDNSLDSTRQDILQDFTGRFSQRVADNQLFTDIKSRMNQIQNEMSLIFSSIFY